MTSYLSNSCLFGLRPKRHMNANIQTRPDLISKLMRERQVSRFLVAPSGYGKTYVALEYAQMLFDFQNTCWLECRSPCFLRDLDTHNLATALLGRDPDLRLVVFDDVPRLGSLRAEALSMAIDVLLETGVEVLVTCKPACDAFSGRQIDRICLGAHDLLLSRAEVEQYRETFTSPERQDFGFFDEVNVGVEDVGLAGGGLADEIVGGFSGVKFQGGFGAAAYNTQTPQQEINWQQRIPLLAWGGAGAYAQFGAGLGSEEVPDVAAATMFAMLIFRQAPLVWACEMCGLPTPDINAFSQNFPHLGISRSTGTFCTINLALQHVVSGFASQADKIIAAFGQNSTDSAASMLTNILLELNRPSRACGVAHFYGTKAFRAEWLFKNDRRLFQNLCVLPAHIASLSAKPMRGQVAYNVEALISWQHVILGEVRTAMQGATQLASAGGAPARARAWGLALVALYAKDAEVRTAVSQRLAALSSACEDAGDKCWQEDWYALAKCLAAPAAENPVQEVKHLVPKITDNAQFADIAFFALVCLIQRAFLAHNYQVANMLIENATNFSWKDALPFSLFYLLAYQRVHDLYNKNALSLERAAQGGEVRVGADGSSAVGDITQAAETTSAPTPKHAAIAALDGLLTTEVLQLLQRAQLCVEVQQQKYRIHKNAPQPSTNCTQKTPQQTQVPATVKISEVAKYPPLTINIFGGFELTRDGSPVTSKFFTQAKVRALLTLLVLNGGREYSRERLIEALWPVVNEKSGVKNLYSCWSSLVRGLSLSDGSCPYVRRNQGSYQIDKSLVQSDVSTVNSLCKKLTINQISSDKLCEMLEQLNSLYRGDLLPSESKNEFICEERRRLRFQVSDTFSNSAVRLIDLQESKMALWFARVAYSHDHLREDVYYSLMSAQLACGQREAALETYSTCTRMLAKNFRMNPSIRMMTLYKSIVECEEVF